MYFYNESGWQVSGYYCMLEHFLPSMPPFTGLKTAKSKPVLAATLGKYVKVWH